MANLRLPFLLLAIATAYFAAGVELVENNGHQGKGGNTKSAPQHVPAADRADNEAYAPASEETGPSAECEGAENPAVPSIKGASWVAAANGTLPEGALKGGKDHGNIDLYVARAEHKGAIIPGKLHTQYRHCYIPWGNEALGMASYEVLVTPKDQVSWVATPGKTIPPNAIPGGLSCEGGTFFVCRAPHAETLAIGKVQPSHAVCYIAYGSGVHSYSQYEVLVKN